MSSASALWIGIPAISCAVYVLLFFAAGRRSRQETSWFTGFLFVAAFWSLSSMLLHAAPSFLSPLWIARVVALGNLAVGLTIMGFTQQFLSLRGFRRWMLVGVLGYVAIAILTVSGTVVTAVQVNDGLVEIQSSWGLYFVAPFWIFCFYSSAYFLVRELRVTRDPMFRNRLGYILAMLALLVAGITLNVTPLRAYPVDQLCAAVAGILIALSISRYQILEVTRTIRRLGGLVLILLLYVGATTAAINFLGTLGERQLLPIGLLAAAFTAGLLYTYRPARMVVNGVIERILLPELYDVQSLFYSISRTGNRLTLPGQLGGDILREFGRVLQFNSGALLLRQAAENCYATAATLNLPPQAGEVTLRDDSPLVRELAQQRLAMHVDQLQELPRLRALWVEEWEALRRLQTEILLPVLSEAEMIGFFVLGPRRGGEPYTRQELQRTLPTLANQVSLALANSRLYAEEQARADALARANEELRDLARMKDELMQNVSHELRTPLAVIQGYAELLMEGSLTGSEDTQGAARSIFQHTQHLTHLVNQLLMFQRLSRSHIPLAPLAIGPWLAYVSAPWRKGLGECQMALEVDITPDLGLVAAHEDYLRQVLDNLLDNARKFGMAGGCVTLHAWRAGDIFVSVTDQGIGAPPDKLPRLFERFYQVESSSSRRYGGMGLGLALCREIVNLHHGRIWAESPGEGHGLTVTFCLPSLLDPRSA